MHICLRISKNIKKKKSHVNKITYSRIRVKKMDSHIIDKLKFMSASIIICLLVFYLLNNGNKK